MSEHPHAGRIAAVAHLSAAYALALCAEQALDDHNVADDEYGIAATLSLGEAFHDLADHWMEPCGVANVLQTVEEWLANGTRVPSVTMCGVALPAQYTSRPSIVTAIVDARQAAKADEALPDCAKASERTYEDRGVVS